MSNLTVILDNGHGGVINGVPQTAGKRSPDFGKGVIYEGVSNRDLVQRIAKRLAAKGIPYKILVPEETDVPLSTRVQRANKIWQEANKKAFLVSIHSDAYTNETANGWSAFTTPGQTKSDAIADELYASFAKFFPEKNARKDKKDGDPDWEAHFYILAKTFCPAVLVENFFMTNKADYALLKDEDFREKLAECIAHAIEKVSSKTNL